MVTQRNLLRQWSVCAVSVAVLSAALALIACQRQSKTVPAERVEQARAALVPFKEQLVDALMGALEEGGPENAIHVCRDRAPEIAARLSLGGVEMGRTSHKLRNPDNAPKPWVEPLLAAYVENPQASEPRAVWLDESRIGYVEPIYAMHFCLSCHGPSIEPALADTIRELYPQDQATGFRNKDFRGLFWLTMPVEGSAAGAATGPAE